MIATLMLAATLTMAHTSSGVTRQQPKDTLDVDGRRFIGVAVPTSVKFVEGDVNYDGRLATSDIIVLVGKVFRDKPFPTSGDTLAFQVRKDTTDYLFIPTGGRSR